VEEGGVLPKGGEEVFEAKGKEVVPVGIRGMSVNGEVKPFLMETRWEGNTMSKKHSWGLSLLACALAVGLLVGTAGVATAADPASGPFEVPALTNFDLISTSLEEFTFAKLDARGHLDGNILYTGCYLPDQCFRVVDVSDPENLILLASPPVFDMVHAPAPPVPPGGINFADHNDPRWKAWYDDSYNFTLTIKESVPSDPSTPPQYCEDWLTPTSPGWMGSPTCWDPGWNTHSHYVQENNKILVANQERYRTAGTSKRASYAGLTIWDVRDPANPVYLKRFEFPKGPRLGNGTYTQSGGVHHFFFDGRYVYGGTEHGPYIDKDGVQQDGFNDRIFFIVDLKKPKNPVEVGMWWVPGQRDDEYRYWIPVGNFSSPIYIDPGGNLHQKVGLHYIFVQGNRAYLSYHQAGVIILDITKVSDPKFISRLDYLLPPNYVYTDANGVDHERPPLASGQPDASPDDATCASANSTLPNLGIACGNTHAAKIVPGRNLLLVSDEYFSCPYGHVRIVDINDEKNPRVISHFSYPTQNDCSRNWDADVPPNTTPTAHLGFAQNSNLYFMAWYAYGLRGIDISDPRNPKEAGHFFYRILNDSQTSVTYDVAHGPHGLLYLTDNVSGIRVLKYTGQGNK
jgi:hypothetical protein